MYYFGFISVVGVSLLLQVAAAFLAMRLIRITGTNRAWIVIALGLLAMAVRRAAVLASVLYGPGIIEPEAFWSESIGLLNAVLMLAGIAAIDPLFRTVQRAKETTQRDRDQLEKEVQQRTSDLVRANEKLQKEFDERAKVEQALREEHLRQRQLLHMSERDQRLIAYEIHDGFVQPATAALMHLQAGTAIFATNPEGAMDYFTRAVQLLQESIAQVRLLISGLRPVILEDQGLVAAVDKLISDTRNRTAVQIGWSHQVAFDRLPASLETAIFRIIQEALRNSLRHSRSERIEIALRQIGSTAVATVRDWGCGFDLSQSKPDHFGLEGMRERARMLGGALRIESAPGQGTCVTVEFPSTSGFPA
jgi:signal transduction histidine kinase